MASRVVRKASRFGCRECTTSPRQHLLGKLLRCVLYQIYQNSTPLAPWLGILQVLTLASGITTTSTVLASGHSIYLVLLRQRILHPSTSRTSSTIALYNCRRPEPMSGSQSWFPAGMATYGIGSLLRTPLANEAINQQTRV